MPTKITRKPLDQQSKIGLDGDGGLVRLEPSKKHKGKAFRLSWDYDPLAEAQRINEKKRVKAKKKRKIAKLSRKKNR